MSKKFLMINKFVNKLYLNILCYLIFVSKSDKQKSVEKKPVE